MITNNMREWKGRIDVAGGSRRLVKRILAENEDSALLKLQRMARQLEAIGAIGQHVAISVKEVA